MPEAHQTIPISPYGVGKLAAEGMARQVLGGRGVPFTALRYFNTFGPGQAYTPYVGVITIFIASLLAGRSVTIFGDGEQQRDFVHVRDIAAGTVGTVGRSPGTYNLGTGRGLTLNRLVELLGRTMGVTPAAVHAPAQAGELRYSVADISAAREALGYLPTRSLETDLSEVIADIASR
jgi:UDP-glucose 4-epimerase